MLRPNVKVESFFFSHSFTFNFSFFLKSKIRAVASFPKIKRDPNQAVKHSYVLKQLLKDFA